MKFLNQLFSKKKPKSISVDEQSLTVNIHYQLEDISELYKLDSDLTDAISKANVGLYDGHEIAVDLSHSILFMFGPSADELLRIAEPILRKHVWPLGGECCRRYGPSSDPQSKEVFSTI
jgi:hypothetical protein